MTLGELYDQLSFLLREGRANRGDRVMLRYHLNKDVIVGMPVQRIHRDGFHQHLNLHSEIAAQAEPPDGE